MIADVDVVRLADAAKELADAGSTVTAVPLEVGDEAAGEAEARLFGRDLNLDAIEANHAALAESADPGRVGEQVVEALREQLYVIVTHREWGDLYRRENADIEAAYDAFDGRHDPDRTAQAMVSGDHAICH